MHSAESVSFEAQLLQKHQDYLLVYNPVAGSRKKIDIHQLITNAGLSGRVKVVPTEFAGHATSIAKEAARNGYKRIIAAGGDGTVNEVANGLLGSDTDLAILPLGSGNGLARHLKLSLHPLKALEQALTAPSIWSDVASLNDQIYLCTAGVGYDAEVAQTFAQIAAKRGRGLLNYLWAGWLAYNRFKPSAYKISIDDNTLELDAFSVTVANASQFGNNAIISNSASLTDGLLDLCIIHPFPWLTGAEMTTRLFSGSLEASSRYQRLRGKLIAIERQSQGWLHYDGEPHVKPARLNFGIKPTAIKLVGFNH